MTNTNIHISAESRHRQRLKQLRKRWQLFAFIAIPVIYIIVFKYVPMIGVQIAFRDYNFSGGIWNSEWVGLDQFKKFFNSYQFIRVLTNTIRLSFYTIIASFPIPVIIALGLNVMQNHRYRKAVQTIIYVPHFISTVVVVGILLQLFNFRIGLYGNIMRAITGTYPVDLFSKAHLFPHFYVWSGIWQSVGWSTIIYTAALSSVDPQLHESAMIDGASRFLRVIHIDLPSILPTIIVLLILRSGSILSIGFEKVFLMQNNLNLSTSEVISTYVYKVGLMQGSDFSYATAIGLFNSLINIIMLVLVNSIARKIGESSLW